MSIDLVHEIELYPFESFRILLEHEVIRARRYKSPLSLLHIAVEANAEDPQAQHSAEVFAINVLNLYLRETDIPCRDGNEFLVLLPATDEQGGRIACERLEKLFTVEPHQYDRVSFTFSTYIGLATSMASHFQCCVAVNCLQALQSERQVIRRVIISVANPLGVTAIQDLLDVVSERQDAPVSHRQGRHVLLDRRVLRQARHHALELGLELLVIAHRCLHPRIRLNPPYFRRGGFNVGVTLPRPTLPRTVGSLVSSGRTLLRP